MTWPAGLKLLDSINFNGVFYNLIILKQNDVGIVTYYFRVVKGDWQIPWDTQEAILQGNFPDAGDVVALVADRLAYINKSLATYFGGQIPVTFMERLEAALTAWRLVLKNGIPQVE